MSNRDRYGTTDVSFDATIWIGNDAMMTGADVAEALRSLAKEIEEEGALTPGCFRKEVRDRNGNRVGGAWVMERDDLP